VILRSNFKSRSDADIKSAVEHGKRVKVYPLGGNPDSTVFVDAYDKPFDATIPYDATFSNCSTVSCRQSRGSHATR
jgi:hypothetical protein